MDDDALNIRNWGYYEPAFKGHLGLQLMSSMAGNAQMTAVAIDIMMGYRLLSNLAIVAWVFSPGNVAQFNTSDHPWEVHHELSLSLFSCIHISLFCCEIFLTFYAYENRCMRRK
ncbi:hypothetical protein K2173_001758 [Erythroxylum novogranatense]|uniref:Uncharacterized protein n=1 Tax=Erythroxylum novogranatense TaxID=1862640 RepID=A0AAV8S8C7_9ROSI|nr:hypothetical protein K2173_001758 [Erythroxylum novogranatense]